MILVYKYVRICKYVCNIGIYAKMHVHILELASKNPSQSALACVSVHAPTHKTTTTTTTTTTKIIIIQNAHMYVSTLNAS